MAEQAGVNAQKFGNVSRDQIRAILLQLSRYIKDLQILKKSGTPGAGAMPVLPNVTGMTAPDVTMAPAAKPATIVIDVTPEGFPIVPNVSFEKLKKEDLEDLMWSYLNKHYGTVFCSH
jgi:hypothetical protein